MRGFIKFIALLNFLWVTFQRKIYLENIINRHYLGGFFDAKSTEHLYEQETAFRFTRSQSYPYIVCLPMDRSQSLKAEIENLLEFPLKHISIDEGRKLQYFYTTSSPKTLQNISSRGMLSVPFSPLLKIHSSVVDLISREHPPPFPFTPTIPSVASDLSSVYHSRLHTSKIAPKFLAIDFDSALISHEQLGESTITALSLSQHRRARSRADIELTMNKIISELSKNSDGSDAGTFAILILCF